MEGIKIIFLASLLHDIGKFYQRGNKRKRTTAHQELSEEWIKQNLNVPSQVSRIAGAHHERDWEKTDYLVHILQLSDSLSSVERKKREKDAVSLSIQEVLERGLVSLFSQKDKLKVIKPQEITEISNQFSYEENKIGEEEKFLYSPLETDCSGEFKRIWQKFTRESENLKTSSKDFYLFTDQLISLLEKYTSLVPSAVKYVDYPDISLFHHLISTSAIATSLYWEKIEDKEIKKVLSSLREKSDSTNPPAYLQNDSHISVVGIDISGIQDFIYSVTSEKALKYLRGRSLYVELLPKIFYMKLSQTLRDKNFPFSRCNIIYEGGGNLFLLVPSSLLKEIEKVFQTFQEILLKDFKGKLSLVMASYPLRFSDFLKSSKIIDKVRNKLGEEKNKKFSSLMEKNYDYFFKFKMPPEKSSTCSICGGETEEGREVCETCEEFARFSGEFIHSKYLYIKTEKGRYEGNYPLSSHFHSLGIEVRFSRKVFSPSNTYIINSTDFLNESLRGYMFFSKYFPHSSYDKYENESHLMTLEEFAGDKGKSNKKGIKKWAVLRGDIDDLGKVFMGEKLPLFKGGEMSFSRLSTLSSQIKFFFTYHINKILEYVSPEYRVGTIYSGGDDFLFVGYWEDLLFLLEDIDAHFLKFTQNSITLSASLNISPTEKYPFYAIADESGNALKEAKEENDGEKHKLNFSGYILSLGKLKEIRNLASEMKIRIPEKIPRSFLYLLYHAFLEEEKVKSGEIPYSMFWITIYNFVRLKERIKDEKDIERLNEWRDKFFNLSEYKFRDEWIASILWADLGTRRE